MANKYNVLSTRHFNRIGKRSRHMAQKLTPLWTVTFLTKGRMLVPAGSVSMQVLTGQMAEEREQLELSCITAEIDHHNGTTYFSRPRMSHNFSRRPQPGGRGRVLDPRDPHDPTVKEGEKPNGDWVRWAFDADRMRVTAVEQNYRLAAAPELPRIRVGFANPELAPFQMSEQLTRDVANHLGQSLPHIAAMGASTLEVLARAHWGELWTPPQTEGNPTGLWLIDSVYVSSFSRATRVYEDYTHLCGVHVYNPARDIPKGLTQQALLNGVESLPAALAKLVVAEADTNVEAIEDAIMQMVAKIRQKLGYCGACYDDNDIVDAVMQGKGLYVGKYQLQRLPSEQQVAILRNVLAETRPHLLHYVTDEELLKAAADYSAPLYIASLPRIQVLRRDLRVPIEEALCYSPSQLGRERVYANFWVGSWHSRMEYHAAYSTAPRKSRRRQERKNASAE